MRWAWASVAWLSTAALDRMVSAMRWSEACSFIDSPFHRLTTSWNQVAATPPHTVGGMAVI